MITATLITITSTSITISGVAEVIIASGVGAGLFMKLKNRTRC